MKFFSQIMVGALFGCLVLMSNQAFAADAIFEDVDCKPWVKESPEDGCHLKKPVTYLLTFPSAQSPIQGEERKKVRLTHASTEPVNFLNFGVFPRVYDNARVKKVTVRSLSDRDKTLKFRVRPERYFESAGSVTNSSEKCVMVTTLMVSQLFLNTPDKVGQKGWQPVQRIVRPIEFPAAVCNRDDLRGLVLVYETLKALETYKTIKGDYPTDSGWVVNDSCLTEDGFVSSCDIEDATVINHRFANPVRQVFYQNDEANCSISITLESSNAHHGVSAGLRTFSCDFLTAQYCQ